MTTMTCSRAEELFSDDLEGTLHPLLRSELAEHLAAHPQCAALRADFALVVAALHAEPAALAVPSGLAERAASAALAAARAVPRQRATLAGLPRWLQATAAAAAILIAGGSTWVAVRGEPGRMVTRLRDRVVSAGLQLAEQKDRVAEDLRLMGIVVSTAFEARVDKVNDRVDDYRRLLEKRRLEEGARKDRETPPRKRPDADTSSFSNSRPLARVTTFEQHAYRSS